MMSDIQYSPLVDYHLALNYKCHYLYQSSFTIVCCVYLHFLLWNEYAMSFRDSPVNMPQKVEE